MNSVAFFAFVACLLVNTGLCDCPFNSVLGTEPGQCTSCEPGSVSTGQPDSPCTPCSPGSREGRGECFFCEAGTFSASERSTYCQICPLGTIAPSRGMSSCVSCAQGQYSVSSVECRPCPEGLEALNGSCVLCPKGTVKTLDDDGCRPCPVGSFADRQGSSACLLCPEGRFTLSPGASFCNPCPAGSTVIPGLNSTEVCVQCDLGKTTFGDGGPCVIDNQESKPTLSPVVMAGYLFSIGAFGLFAYGLAGIYYLARQKQFGSLAE